MPKVAIQDIRRYAKRTAVVIVGLLVSLAALATWAWHERADIADKVAQIDSTPIHPATVPFRAACCSIKLTSANSSL